MSTVRRHRSPTIQLQLPLNSVPSEATKRLQADWRLDERTRSIGRRGVAAARALLGESTPAPEEAADAGRDVGVGPATSGVTGHDASHDASHGKAGRAA
jgi:hypothetical protein